MTWKSHIAIATAVAIPFSPIAIPFAIVGSTAPDWTEWILKFFGIEVKHRGATHYLYIPILIIVIGTTLGINAIIWFGIGYLTHWFADSLTRSGVPISQFDRHKIHFFGGKLRTGEPAEYIIAYGLLLSSILVVHPTIEKLTNQDKQTTFSVYFMEYGKLYDEHIIDEKTYRENRFKLF